VKWALALVVVAGCADVIGPDIGAPLHATCSDQDSDPGVDISFANDVEAIFAADGAHCLRCHSETGETPLGVEVGGLDLSEYDYLRAGGVRSGADIVVPGLPCVSVLVQKTSDAPPFGARMPLDGPPFLDEEDRQVIADWIAEGAHEN
jgi:hypothetical protein